MVPATTARPTPPPEPVETDAADASSLWDGEGRLHLSLGWPHLVILAVFLVALLFGAFQAGKRSVTPPSDERGDLPSLLEESTTPAPPAEQTPRRRSPLRPTGRDAETPVVRGEPAERESPLPPPTPEDFRPPTRVEFEEGQYYVIAQYFRRSDKADADAARTFLQSKGIECVVHQGPQRDWWLVAAEAFPTASAADSLIRRIKEAGKEFARAGGGYDFAGCMARKIRTGS